ncbi:MAG: hypothetical protein WAO52_02400 [Prolixibacteraceae bacterium]
MRSELALKAMFADPRMKELIDSLWREYPGLYNEKYNRDPQQWLSNQFCEEIDFGQALGQDHFLNGNQSTAIGIGAISRAFREIVLGSYASDEALQNPTEWDELDRLISVGNGIDADNRHDALILFKSGLLKLQNAFKIGAFEHGLVDPEDGTIQYTPGKAFEFRHLNEWITLLTEAPVNNKPYGRQNNQWVEVAALDHDHNLGDLVLVFENRIT